MTAVFETLRVKQGALPLLERHLERLELSRQAIGLPSLPDGLGERLLSEASSGPAEGILRVQWDGRLEITRRGLPDLGPVRLITSTVVHTGYPVKTTDREMFDRARAEALERGADEGVLLTPHGYVAEGSLFAIGWFEGGKLRVPSLELGILPSIGRARAIEVARELGMEVEEGGFGRELLDGRPAWITTAVRGVVAVAELDGVEVPQDGRIQALAGGFWPSG
jgi:branched-subunit amino acid aminotransferase/4-amino-4-deoxychorismate lyase